MIKENKKISGIFFRFKNPETGNVENRCFEDLPKEEQLKRLNGKSKEYCINMAILLADCINQMSDYFNITCNTDEKE